MDSDNDQVYKEYVEFRRNLFAENNINIGEIAKNNWDYLVKFNVSENQREVLDRLWKMSGSREDFEIFKAEIAPMYIAASKELQILRDNLNNQTEYQLNLINQFNDLTKDIDVDVHKIAAYSSEEDAVIVVKFYNNPTDELFKQAKNIVMRYSRNG